MSLTLRDSRAADVEAMLEVYAPYVRNTAITFEVEVPSAEVHLQRWQSSRRHHPWLVAEEEGAVVGYAYAGPHRARAAYRYCAELSVYVKGHAHGRGVGGSLYAALIGLLEIQGMRNLYRGVTLPNRASERLHLRLGFQRIGVYRAIGYKLGEWHDVSWFGRRLGDDDCPPRSHLPDPDEVIASAAGQALMRS